MGDHSGPYASADPNKSEEQIDLESALAWAKWQRGQSPDEISKELGISRRTFYYRLEKLISAHGRPSRALMQMMEMERLDSYTRRAEERLDGDVSNSDAARLLAEARQLSLARQRLFALDLETASEDELGDNEQWADNSVDSLHY